MPDDRIRPEDPTPRPKRPLRDEVDEVRPAKRRRDDDDDDYDDRPRRRPRHDNEEQGDMTGGLIPYKNGAALAAYYLGVFGLIPGLGMLLGPLALIFGFLGFRFGRAHPKAGGLAHAIVGILLGTLIVVGHIAVVILLITGILAK